MGRKIIRDMAYWKQLARETGYKPDHLAKRLGVSRRQLQRYTQELFKRSPKDWLGEQKLLLAPVLIKAHNSVKIAAAELGFKQTSHFSRKFKEYYGQCPSQLLPSRGLNPPFLRVKKCKKTMNLMVDFLEPGFSSELVENMLNR